MLEQTHFQHNDEKHGIEKKKKRKRKTWVRMLFPPYSPNRTMEPAPAKIVEIEKGINEMFLNSQPALLSKLANIRCG